MLFEWYYPDNIKTLGKALKIWAHDPDVTTPILKCNNYVIIRAFYIICIIRYDRAVTE